MGGWTAVSLHPADHGDMDWPVLAVVKRPGILNAPTAARGVARPSVAPSGQRTRRPDRGTVAAVSAS